MALQTSNLSVIGFDADDTLWQNEHFFRVAEGRLAELLTGNTHAESLSAKLLECQNRNLGIYGFGIKGFTLSMIETAIEMTDGSVSTAVIREILAVGRDMLGHPLELLPYVEETLRELASTYRLVLITKGDLLDQERKLAQSGLAQFFDAVEIVSDKTPATYARIFTRHGDGPSRSLMVGNSLKSDIVPAIQAGSWGVHVPHHLTWAFEHAQAPVHEPRFRQVTHVGELINLLKALEPG